MPFGSAAFATPRVGCMTPIEMLLTTHDEPLVRPGPAAPERRRAAARAGAAEGSLWTSLDVVQRHRLHQHRPGRAGRATAAPRAPCSSPRSRPPGAAGWTGAGRRRPAPGCSSRCCCEPGDDGARASAGAGCRCSPGSPPRPGSSRAAGVDTALKWPNDLLVTVDGEERKAGGILAERAGEDGVVVGIGINVTLRDDELPVPAAGSLALAGRREHGPGPAAAGRAALAGATGTAPGARPSGDPAASGLQEAYAAGCATLGRTVRAELPGGGRSSGRRWRSTATAGWCWPRRTGVQQPVGAGDIVHLRAVSERCFWG